MVLLDMDQQVKMRCDSTENNIKDLAEEKENCGGEEKGSPDECNGKEEQLEGEEGGFVEVVVFFVGGVFLLTCLLY